MHLTAPILALPRISLNEDGGGSIDIDELIKLVIGLFNMDGGEEDNEVLLACFLDIF